MTEQEKNQIVVKFEPLINKLVKQYHEKVCCSWEDIKSMAYEGLAIALRNYDKERSNMSFTQFAGFAIRNNILTSLDNELRTVKLSAYAQKKTIDAGGESFNTISIDNYLLGNDDNSKGKNKTREFSELCQEATFSDGDTFETLYSKIEDNFSKRDCEIFYMTFGLKNYDETKGIDIAEYFGISRSLVSIRVKTIIEFIRKDSELCECLANLLK